MSKSKSSKLLSISERGTITLPKEARESLGTRYVMCRWNSDNILLQPVQTREEFLAELDEAEKDWEDRGGASWDEVMETAQRN